MTEEKYSKLYQMMTSNNKADVDLGFEMIKLFNPESKDPEALESWQYNELLHQCLYNY